MRKTYCEETHCQMFEHTKKQIRAEVIEEVFDKAYDVDMDSSLIYVRFDKEEFDVPFLPIKTELKEWLMEKLKEQK